MSLSLIRNHLQTAGEHVGDMLWWTLEDARISRDRLEEVWVGAGLSTALLPEPPTPEKALRTAVREAQVGQQGHLIRLGKEDDDELVFAVVEEQHDGSGNVSYRQEARIVLRRLVTRSSRATPPTTNCPRCSRALRASPHHAHAGRRPPCAREDPGRLRSRDAPRARRRLLGPDAVRRHAAPAAGGGRRDWGQPHRRRPHSRDA